MFCFERLCALFCLCGVCEVFGDVVWYVFGCVLCCVCVLLYVWFVSDVACDVCMVCVVRRCVCACGDKHCLCVVCNVLRGVVWFVVCDFVFACLAVFVMCV